MIKDACLGRDFLLPGIALFFRFNDSPDDLLYSFVEQINLGDSGTHDGRIVFAETISIRFEILVNTADKEHVRFDLTDRFHKSLQDVL